MRINIIFAAVQPVRLGLEGKDPLKAMCTIFRFRKQHFVAYLFKIGLKSRKMLVQTIFFSVYQMFTYMYICRIQWRNHAGFENKHIMLLLFFCLFFVVVFVVVVVVFFLLLFFFVFF